MYNMISVNKIGQMYKLNTLVQTKYVVLTLKCNSVTHDSFKHIYCIAHLTHFRKI